MLKYIFLVFALGIFLSPLAQAQVMSPEEAREKLNSSGMGGIQDEEVVKRLKERGFDVDNLDPSDLPALEVALGEIAIELEAQKAAEEKVEEVAVDASEKITEAIEEGASVEEAVATELIEVQNDDLKRSNVYGKNLYRNGSIRLFSENYDVKPTLDYVLGAGDVVSIDIWGVSEESGTYEIAPEGFIKPSRMPRINLKGVTYGRAKELVRSRFAQYYNFRPEEFELTVSYARAINVNIYGEVINPGSYTIPALNTGFNALVAAGGPSEIGTVRNIRIINGSGQVREMDLYEFLLNPSISKDFYLSDNDFIYVDVAKKVVEIQGAVKRPMSYELKDSEQLNKLITFAGGFTDRAYKANIQIKRFENDSERIIDLDFRKLSSSGDFPLLPGDVVTINEIPKPFQNFAEVTGAVELESKYEINSRTRVSDLMDKAILAKGARRDMAFLLRKNSDRTIRTIQLNLADILANGQSDANIQVQPEDRLMILSSARFIDNLPITISGSVRNPIDHPFDPDKGIRVSEAVILADGVRKDAADFAYVFRKESPLQKDVEYIRVDINQAIANPDSPSDLQLKGGDELRIYSKLSFSDDLMIKVNGSVRQPGDYAFDPSLNLRDVLSLAGGLELAASRSKIDVSRISMDDDQKTTTSLITVEVDENFEIVDGPSFQLQPFDQIYVRRAPEFELQRNVTINGEVKFPGVHPMLNENERLLTVIKQAGGLTQEAFERGITLYRSKGGVGYVVVDLVKAIKNPKSSFNLILQEGDEIRIPKKQALVSIHGETKAKEVLVDELATAKKINVPYETGKSPVYYVENYVAGVGEKGRKRLITVEHPNGEFQRTKRFLFLKFYPEVREGSKITVGKKVKNKSERVPKEKEDIDWGKVVANSIAQATAVLSLILLVQNVK